MLEEITNCWIKDWAELSTCNKPTGNEFRSHDTVIYMWLRYGSITPSVSELKNILMTYPGQYWPPLDIG